MSLTGLGYQEEGLLSAFTVEAGIQGKERTVVGRDGVKDTLTSESKDKTETWNGDGSDFVKRFCFWRTLTSIHTV